MGPTKRTRSIDLVGTISFDCSIRSTSEDEPLYCPVIVHVQQHSRLDVWRRLMIIFLCLMDKDTTSRKLLRIRKERGGLSACLVQDISDM